MFVEPGSLVYIFSFVIFSQAIVLQLDDPSVNDSNPVTEKFAFCDDNHIYFTLVFDRPFSGVIYTYGEYPNQKCTYADGRTFSAKRYNITIPLDDCSSLRFPNGTRQNTVIVQRDPNILQSYDRLYIITCSQSTKQADRSANYYYSGGYGVNRRVTLSFSGITVENALNTTEFITDTNPVQASTSSSNVDYDVEVQIGKGPDSRAVDRPLIIGEPISYVVKLKNLDRSTDAKIGRCWATDGESEIQLSDDEGCTIQSSNNIWNNFRTISDPSNSSLRILVNEIKTWAFPTSNRVNIFCNLHICSPVCSLVSCNKSFSANVVLSKSSKVKRSTMLNGSSDEVDQLSDPFLEKTVRLQFGYNVKPISAAKDAVNSDYSRKFDGNFSSLLSYNLTARPVNQTADTMNSSIKICLTRANFTTAFVLLGFCILMATMAAVTLFIYVLRGCQFFTSRRYVVRHYSTLTLHSGNEAIKF